MNINSFCFLFIGYFSFFPQQSASSTHCSSVFLILDGMHWHDGVSHSRVQKGGGVCVQFFIHHIGFGHSLNSSLGGQDRAKK
jgi:hypothetical protein